MPRSDREPGVNLARARALLEGLPARELDVDSLAMDRDGHFAILLGSDESEAALGNAGHRMSVEATTAASRVLAHVAVAPLEEVRNPTDALGYRAAAFHASEPIFDAPLAGPGSPLHEDASEGYRHLFTADPIDTDKACALRRHMDENGGVEQVVRERFAIVIADVADPVYREIHARRLCSGCIVLEDPDDPRPRSIEVLASSGFYVYRFAPEAWVRAASPSVPIAIDAVAGLTDLRTMAPRLAICFEETLTVPLTPPLG